MGYTGEISLRSGPKAYPNAVKAVMVVGRGRQGAHYCNKALRNKQVNYKS